MDNNPFKYERRAANIDRPASALLKRRHSAGLAASAGLTLVVFTLTGFVVWSSVTSSRLTTQAVDAARMNDYYQTAHYAVGAEESLERKYRLEPSPEVLASHRRAGQSLVGALTAAEQMSSPRDRALILSTLRDHDLYLTTTVQMFAAVDAGDKKRVEFVDEYVTDPVFGRIENVVNREATANHAASLDAMTELTMTQHRVYTETIAIFGVGLVLLGICLLVLRELSIGMLRKAKAELSEAEKQLVHSLKLAALGTLSAGVAHELNQPIAIVRGVVQQLQGEPDLSSDVRSDLELVEGQTKRMMKIVNHLRSFARVGSETFGTVAVNDIIRDGLLLVSSQLATQNVALELDLGDVPDVHGDAHELEQVFINLITNARDAVEGSPEARIVVRSLVEDGQVVIQVRDNGPGIGLPLADRIFEPFFTTKDVGKGTGLGLSISHGIIKRHRGTIDVHDDGGAVFTIRLPESPPAALERDIRAAA